MDASSLKQYVRHIQAEAQPIQEFEEELGSDNSNDVDDEMNQGEETKFICILQHLFAFMIPSKENGEIIHY